MASSECDGHSREPIPSRPGASQSSSGTDDKPETKSVSLTLNPKRRKGAPKTKSGCLTCKIRRVKCDEGKPTCNRCQKSKITCSGYAPPKPKSVSLHTTKYRPLVPLDTAPPQPSIDMARKLSLSPSPTATSFDNVREYYYYTTFCEDFLPGVSNSLVTPGGWSRILLQESQNEISVRHAISAVSALIKWLDTKARDPDSPRTNALLTESDNHHIFALRLYHKAVKGMRLIKRPRAALLACLVIFIFESLSQRSDLAVAQVQSGLKLLNNLSSSSRAGSWSKRASDLTSPVIYIEDELVRIFVSLEIQILPFGRSQPLSCQKTFYQNINPDREAFPPSGFSSFHAARESLERIMARGIDSQAFGVPYRRTTDDPLFKGNGPGPWTCVSTAFSSEISIEQCYTETDTWALAFQPLFIAAQEAKESDDYMQAISLRLQAKMTKVLLARMFFPMECQFDSLMEDFFEIVDLCKAHIAHPSFTPQPTPKKVLMNQGIILPLLVTALRCRHRKLRREAMALLGTLKRREGVMESEVFTKFAGWIIGLEEEGLDDGLMMEIPEEKRVSISRVRIDSQKKIVDAVCERKLVGGGYEEFSTTLRW